MSTSKSAEIFAGTYDPPEHLWLAVHFSPSPSSRTAGLAFLKRKLLRRDRDPEVSEEAAAVQREAFNKYYTPAESGLYYLKDIRQQRWSCRQQRCHRAHGELIHPGAEPAECEADPLPGHKSRIVLPDPELFVLQANQFLTSALQGDDANLPPSERLPFPSIISAMHEGSSIVLLSSLAVRAAVGTLSAYAATKGAVETLVKHFA